MNSQTTPLARLAGEPYRVFFPLALLAGVCGVLLWPLFYASQISWIPNQLQLGFYPNLAHSHLMIEGFVGGFAIGFVGTAGPKLLSSRPLHPAQLLTLLALHLTLCGFHLIGQTQAGDIGFAAMILVLLTSLLSRVRSAKQFPPPGLLLAGLGLLAGALGALWMALVGLQGDIHFYAFSQRLLYQGVILLPLMGIGGYIFPMILGTTNHHASLSGSRATRAWKFKAAEALTLGCLTLGTYWVEVHGNRPAMSLVRLLLCGFWLTKECGWLQRDRAKGIMPFALRCGILSLLAGMLAVGITDRHSIALDHSLYIGGFGLITMIVATRVIYGHSGQGEKFQRWIKPLGWTCGLLLFTMLTRVSADFMPHIMLSHHVYAALLWVVVSAIWGIALLPSVRKYPSPKISNHKPGQQTSVLNMNFRNSKPDDKPRL